MKFRFTTVEFRSACVILISNTEEDELSNGARAVCLGSMHKHKRMNWTGLGAIPGQGERMRGDNGVNFCFIPDGQIAISSPPGIQAGRYWPDRVTFAPSVEIVYP